MADDFIKEQVRNIDTRLKEIERELANYDLLVAERERLQAARAAYTGNNGGAPAGTRKRAASTGTRRRRRGGRGSGPTNAEKVIEAIRGGAGTVAEIREKSGVEIASNVLSKLRREGQVDKDKGGKWVLTG